MALLLSAIAVLVPLIITPGLLFYFDVTPKAAVLLIGTSIGLLPGILLPSRDLLRRRDREGAAWPRLARSFAILLGLQALSLTAATVASPLWQLSVIGTNWRRFGLITYCALLVFALLATIALAGRR